MRVALVSTPFTSVPPRGYGGTELVIHQLARGLTAAGHEVVLYATGDSQGDEVRWVFDRPAWPPDPASEAIHCRAAARAIAHDQFDLVHAHAPAFLEVGDVGAPVVYTIHHARDEQSLARYQRRPDVHYVAISRRQADLAPELCCTVIHHGLDVAAVEGGGDGDFVLFLGRLSWCKGPDLAIEAARAAGVEIVVAGELHDEEDNPPGWGERIQGLLPSPGVRAIGGVAGQRKEQLLVSARALIAPIRWEEPFGLVLIEATLRGTPAVAMRRGAAPEIVEDGVTGILVDDEADLADALRRAVTLDRAACRGRARARFGAARMVQDHLRLYREARSGAQRAPVVAAEAPTYAS